MISELRPWHNLHSDTGTNLGALRETPGEKMGSLG